MRCAHKGTACSTICSIISRAFVRVRCGNRSRRKRARDFAAREYLGAAATAGGIASGQVAGVAFDVVDPSPRVTAFTFEFR